MNGYFRREENVFDQPDFARMIDARLNAGVALGGSRWTWRERSPARAGPGCNRNRHQACRRHGR